MQEKANVKGKTLTKNIGSKKCKSFKGGENLESEFQKVNINLELEEWQHDLLKTISRHYGYESLEEYLKQVLFKHIQAEKKHYFLDFD